MRVSIILASFAATAACALLAAPVFAQPVALTGKMQPFLYLLGTPWSCTTNVPAMGGQQAHTDQGTGGFEVAPGNVIRSHFSTPNYSGDFYNGYSDKLNMYWQTSADNLGGHSFLTSSDGKTYAGTVSMGPMSAQETVTYNRVNANTITVHEVISGGNMPGTFDSTCTR